MILEIDCGNSLIKWRIVNNHNDVIVRGANQQLQQILVDINCYQAPLQFCRLVSVRSEEETLQLIDHIKNRYNIPIKQALSKSESLGVINGYNDYTRLGADRWATIVASYQYSQTATVVLGFGTAITSDFIDKNGQHLGGFITPGLLLMRQQLLSHTSRIYYDETVAKMLSSTDKLLGKSTEEAINSGCHIMIQGFISQQLTLANKYLGQSFKLYAHGGDAIHFNIPNMSHMPDLVFNGLAFLCPFSDD